MYCEQCSLEFHSSEFMWFIVVHYVDGSHNEHASILICLDSDLVTDIIVKRMRFEYNDVRRILVENGVPVTSIPPISIEEAEDYTDVIIEMPENENQVWSQVFGNTLIENYILHSSANPLRTVLLEVCAKMMRQPQPEQMQQQLLQMPQMQHPYYYTSMSVSIHMYGREEKVQNLIKSTGEYFYDR